MNVNIRLHQFKKAIDNLDNVMQESKSDIVRDAAIKRYEICYELAWKSIQEFLKNEGLEICKTPKKCFKEGFQQELISNEEGFSAMVENRNLTTHTYDDNLAESIYKNIPDYLLLFQMLYNEIGLKYENEK